MGVFKNIGYIGGFEGRPLIIDSNGMSFRYLKVMLPGFNQLFLEQVFLYRGDECLSIGKAAKSSSVLEGNSERFGPFKACDGHVDGYSYHATELEHNPCWVVDLNQVERIDRVEVFNFCTNGIVHNASALKLFVSASGDIWEEVYSRKAGKEQIALENECIKELDGLFAYPWLGQQKLYNIWCSQRSEEANREELSKLIGECLQSLALTAMNNAIVSYSAPGTLKIRSSYCGELIITDQLKIIKNVSVVRFDDLLLRNVSTELVGDGLLSLDWDSLEVEFKEDTPAYFHSSVNIQVKSEAGLISLFDSYHLDVAEKAAWLAFLSGNETAENIATYVSAKILLSRSEEEVRQAYFFGRFNLHGKSVAYQRKVIHIINKNFSIVDKKVRAFSRHGFTRPLASYDLDSYAKAISKIMSSLPVDESFLFYGSLLGLHRNGDLIPHDDDVDVAYISRCSCMGEVWDERNRIISKLKSSGFEVDNYSDTILPFKVFHIVGDDKYEVEIFPSWLTDEGWHLYMSLMQWDCIPKAIYKGYEYIEYRGERLRVLADPLEFLTRRYGESWETPSNTFEF